MRGVPAFFRFKTADLWGIAAYIVLVILAFVYTFFVTGIHGGDGLFISLVLAWPAVLLEWLNEVFGLGFELNFLTALLPLYILLNIFLVLIVSRKIRLARVKTRAANQ